MRRLTIWKRILREIVIIAVGTLIFLGLAASIGIDRSEQPVASGQPASPPLSMFGE